MPLAGTHREAGDSSSTPGLLKREARKSQQGAQQTPRAFVQGGGGEESLNERSGDFILQPCKKCPQAHKRVAARTRSESALVPWTGGRKLRFCACRVGSSNSGSAATSRRFPTSLFPPSDQDPHFPEFTRGADEANQTGVVPPDTEAP